MCRGRHGVPSGLRAQRVNVNMLNTDRMSRKEDVFVIMVVLVARQ